MAPAPGGNRAVTTTVMWPPGARLAVNDTGPVPVAADTDEPALAVAVHDSLAKASDPYGTDRASVTATLVTAAELGLVSTNVNTDVPPSVAPLSLGVRVASRIGGGVSASMPANVTGRTPAPTTWPWS